MSKLLFREIRGSLGRFLAIMAIIALGVGFFAGLRVTQTAMIETGGEYLEEQKFNDFRILSTLGVTAKDVDAFLAVEGVADAEGSVSVDALITSGEAETAMKVYSLPERINLPKVIYGRLPRSSNECVVDAMAFGKDAIGSRLTVSENNTEATAEMFLSKSYTITGIVISPLYINYERGSTSLASGTVSGFVYIPQNGLDYDCFTEIDVRLTERADIYSERYDESCEKAEPLLTDLIEKRAVIRYDDIKTDAEEELADAEKKVADGEQKLEDALLELADGEKEYEKGVKKLEESKNQCYNARKSLDSAEAELSAGKAALDQGEQELAAKEAELNSARQKLDNGRAQLNAAQALIDAQASQYSAADPSDPAVQAVLAQLAAAQQQLNAQKALLDEQELAYQAGAAAFAQGKQTLAAKRSEYEAGVKQVTEGREALSGAWAAIKQGEQELDDARKELDDGWAEVNDSRKELADAKEEIADGRRELAELEPADCYVLGRDTNIGYVCFESDTGIVKGVSDVFPLFFFLVAALVCITTMTRMVDEQRTQIGTLKALGYSDTAIMGKYLWYAVSASIVGCVVGFLGGSWVFPRVLWLVYDIMYDFYRPIKFVLDLKLAGISILMYLLCAVIATWSSCKTELREVAAQLIRPKSPKAGKRILLERVPFIWNRMKFLHKVSARNVFRYHKRLIMMVLGIGGCMGLLLTGLGLNDSIQNIVDDQFDKISLYDISLTFRDDMDAESKRLLSDECGKVIGDIVFLHEGTTDVHSDSSVKTSNFIVFRDSLDDFVRLFDKNGNTVNLPNEGETVINYGLAESLGVKVGDTVTVFNENNKRMELVISGLCENYIYNYIYVSESSCISAWGEAPGQRTAYINAAEGGDLHAQAAVLMEGTNVLQTTVNNDLRDRVGSIMNSMNYIVLLVIVCAGSLAFIVLYNLTNINLGERIREIATIKVLGFYAPETSAYVLRENLILTAIGAAAGIPMGIALHSFVMSQIKIDMITFNVRILGKSYILAVLLCFLFTVIVDLFMRIKISKINMAESLKAAE